MLAKSVAEIPVAAGMSYEPKWDGFRCIVFRDGKDIELGSRNERPLTRYFPELVDSLKAALPARAVVDGEIVIATEHGLDFDQLQQRIHPAASRINKLAAETPSSFVAFDLLAEGDEDLRQQPFAERRARLERMLGKAGAPIHVTPLTNDPTLAHEWFERFEDLGEVAGEGAVVAAAELDLVAVAEHDAAEPVPLRLEDQPAQLGGVRDPLHRLGEHRPDGWHHGQVHGGSV